MSGLHIHAPEPVIVRRRIMHCPTCKRRRRFVLKFYEWYGARCVCVACGDSWNDGEREERPFKRGWRAQAIARAKHEWEALGKGDGMATELEAPTLFEVALMIAYAEARGRAAERADVVEFAKCCGRNVELILDLHVTYAREALDEFAAAVSSGEHVGAAGKAGG